MTLGGCLRQINFLDGEIAALDAEIARQALAWPEVLRLMTVPGIKVQTAATFMASVGDIRRVSSPRQLVSYLGLDPRVRQSGNAAARHGRISKAGCSEARHMLGEVARKVARTPGPLRAFFERVRARRGPQVAATATARNLVVLFWHLLARKQDYAFARPAVTRNKIRQLELLAGAPRLKGRKGVAGNKSKAGFEAERELSRQAEAAYRRLVSDWQAKWTGEGGCGCDTGARISKPSKGKAARQTPQPPRSALRFVSHPHSTPTIAGVSHRHHLTLTDNGSAYRSTMHAIACRAIGVRHLRTRPRRPQTNGKAERFIRTMLAGWADGAIYRSSRERTAALDGWLWHYNHRRRHSALGHQPPITRLNNLIGTYN